MEEYFNCKLELLKLAKHGVINNDDSTVCKIKELLPNKNGLFHTKEGVSLAKGHCNPKHLCT